MSRRNDYAELTRRFALLEEHLGVVHEEPDDLTRLVPVSGVSGDTAGFSIPHIPPAVRLAAAGVATVLVLIALVVLRGATPTWPASVVKVQGEVTQACRNPDVRSEPGQVNFACAPATRQILWVFALMTSRDNPTFSDVRTARTGLEPIDPAQGAQVSWSLNLHHPYSPDSPLDSIEVAARAINNIVGGATTVSPHGVVQVQPGLESTPENCTRYTGSPGLRTRPGFPPVCARQMSPGGLAALAGDVYQQWASGATPQAVQDVETLFEDPTSPGADQVRAVLKNLPAPQA